MGIRGFLRRSLRLRPGRRHRAGEHAHQHPTYTDAELLARAEEFNRNAELHWRKIAQEDAGRQHVLNKPFSTVRDTPDILYRLGLVLSALDLGVGHTVLDFGSGSCWLSSCFNRLRCRTVSVDVSPTALAIGEELFRSDPRHFLELEPRFLPYDGHRIPLADASVERAVCFDSFHHVPNQDEVLAELFRVLKTGGRLVMAEPGEGHAHTDQSMFESGAHGVLENDIHLDELIPRARRAGFDQVLLKPYPDPLALTLTGEEYVRLIDGDAGVFPIHVLQSSLRHFYILILTKGAPVRDSRNPGALAARIEPSVASLSARAGSKATFEARVENAGDTLWLREVQPVGGYVMLGGHLLDEGRQRIATGYLRAALPKDVAPGESVSLAVTVDAPPRLGRYRLQLDMVDEFVAWFEQCGSKTAEVELLVDSWLDSRDPHRLAARLELLGDPPAAAKPGAPRPVRLRLTNEGDTAWHAGPAGERGSVALGAHLLRADGVVVAQDHFRQPLDRAVAPGEAVEIRAEVPGPPEAGRYRLALDLVAEQICWFEQMGSKPLVLEAEATDETPDSRQPGVLRASLALIDHGPRLEGPPGSLERLRVRATNRGNTLWLAAPDKRHGHVALGGRLSSEDGAVLDQDYLRATLPHDVEPGASVEIDCAVRLPDAPGRHRLELDLVDEGLTWFGPRGSETLLLALLVPA